MSGTALPPEPGAGGRADEDPETTAESPAEQLRLLAVHAHADDESITMGGSLATLHDQGVRTALITCTDGQLATIFDPTMDEATTRPILGQVRRAEMANAAQILGLDEFHFLGYRDSGMAGADSNADPEAFWHVDIDAAVGRVVERIRAFRPHVVVTYNANGGYGHPDHIQAHRVTLLAVA
ncbi:MAG: PIG-L family deacetylase, partial [Candidatus Dormibacteria bacterium]